MIASEQILGRDGPGMVERLVANATTGGGALLILGNAGIGKSALLERAVVLARAAGMRVLMTTGVRTEANLPFAGLHQLLRPILDGLDALPKPQYAAMSVAFGLAEGAAEDPFLIALLTLTLLARRCCPHAHPGRRRRRPMAGPPIRRCTRLRRAPPRVRSARDGGGAARG